MFNWAGVYHNIDVEKDYTVKEVAALGIKQHILYSAIKRGVFPDRKVFGKLYINGAFLKEYVSKGIDKVE